MCQVFKWPGIPKEIEWKRHIGEYHCNLLMHTGKICANPIKTMQIILKKFVFLKNIFVRNKILFMLTDELITAF